MASRKWRSVGKVGEPYPAWVRELEGKCGVYAIRVKGLFSTPVVYVGESHKGALRKTLTRHFQSWGRRETYAFKMFRGSYPDPGRTYHRDDCEVCVLTCPARPEGRAIDLQSRWIAELSPRDNEIGAPPPKNEEEVPF